MYIHMYIGNYNECDKEWFLPTGTSVAQFHANIDGTDIEGKANSYYFPQYRPNLSKEELLKYYIRKPNNQIQTLTSKVETNSFFNRNSFY